MTTRQRRIRICYAGTYERDYPRNRLIVAALRRAGCRVEEAHAPVFERLRDKSAPGIGVALILIARLMLAWLRLVPEVALRLLRCDALAVGYIGQADMLVLGPVARLMGKRVIFNPLVTLTDTLVEDRGRFAPGSLPARVIAALDSVALRLADVILVDTDENGRYLRERFGVPAAKLVTVPVGAEESIFFPAATPPAPRERLDVVFIGKFIPLHGIETIVRAASLLQERQAPVRIELVGTGQTYLAMRNLAREIGLDGGDTLAWTDWIPFDLLGERLRRADVALGVFGGGGKAARVIPNKVYGSLACGVATVTMDSLAIRAVLADGDSALLVPPDDPAALADAIQRLTDPCLRQRIAAGGYAAFERSASLDALAEALVPVMTYVTIERAS